MDRGCRDSDLGMLHTLGPKPLAPHSGTHPPKHRFLTSFFTIPSVTIPLLPACPDGSWHPTWGRAWPAWGLPQPLTPRENCGPHWSLRLRVGPLAGLRSGHGQWGQVGTGEGGVREGQWWRRCERVSGMKGGWRNVGACPQCGPRDSCGGIPCRSLLSVGCWVPGN